MIIWIHKPFVRWSLFIVCLLVLLYGNFRPTPPPDLFKNSDKYGHVLVMIAVAISARMAILGPPWYWFWPVTALGAFGLEFLQAALRPLRVFSIGDAYANLAGILVALLLVVIWHLAGRPYGMPETDSA